MATQGVLKAGVCKNHCTKVVASPPNIAISSIPASAIKTFQPLPRPLSGHPTSSELGKRSELDRHVMGKYMKKAKMAGDVAVMDVSQSPLGVRTRARTLAARRKGSSSPASAAGCYLQLRSRRLLKHVVPGKSKDDGCSGVRLVNSGSSPALAGSAHVEDGLEGERGRGRSVRETTPSNIVRGSEALAIPGYTNRPTSSTGTIVQTRSANRRTRSIPTTHEMEEFFAGAERRYNYDPVKDLPLPGRYEWVRLN